MQTYIVELSKEKQRHRRLEIPDGCTLTFGPAVPFRQKQANYGGPPDGYCLRVYDGKLCIAAFNGVISFRRDDVNLSRLTAENAEEVLSDG